jgi:hypothetical protein
MACMSRKSQPGIPASEKALRRGTRHAATGEFIPLVVKLTGIA